MIWIHTVSLGPAVAYMDVPVRRSSGRAKQDTRAVLSRGMTIFLKDSRLRALLSGINRDPKPYPKTNPGPICHTVA